jgi:hypothetical protein
MKMGGTKFPIAPNSPFGLSIVARFSEPTAYTLGSTNHEWRKFVRQKVRWGGGNEGVRLAFSQWETTGARNLGRRPQAGLNLGVAQTQRGKFWREKSVERLKAECPPCD